MTPARTADLVRQLEAARTALVKAGELARDEGVPDRFRQQVTDVRLGVTQVIGRAHEVEVTS